MPRILIVENDEDSRCLFETLLGKSGYEVVSARNGVEALEKLRKNTIDMIISDILMPGMDGFRFCRECKKDDSLMRIPFVFLSANYCNMKDEKFALSLGAEKFIIKPLEPDTFLKIINGVSEKYKKGALVTPQTSIKEEVYLAEYNKRLIETFEGKLLEMEREIIQRKKSEATLKESEEKYHKLMESANDAIFVADAETGVIIDVNRRAEQMTGLPAEEIIGMHQTLLHPPGKEEQYRQIFEDHINSGKAVSKDLFVSHKDGRETPVEISASITVLKGRKIIQGIFRDITERKKAEEQLHQINDQLQISIENMPNAYILLDQDLHAVEWNRAAEKIFGYSKQEMLGKNPFDHIVPKPVRHLVTDILRKLKRGVVADYSEKDNNIRKDGKLISCQWFNTPLADKNGNVFGLLTLAEDITEKKKAEEKLQEQKKALEQKNIALHEVLGQIEIEKKQIKDNVIANAENLLLPVIQKIRIKGESQKYVQLLLKNLRELTSSFGVKLTKRENRLTSREIDICNMIKNGLTSKEISSLLAISPGTIERHRANIRKKLGITNQDINLSSFLRTL